MAKNKVQVDVTVDDHGSLKQVERNAKNSAKSMGELDRNMKGAGQQSANTTKNFSKMSQGMGGLVGAYATLAAQLFALSAAFNFLKSAGDLAVLRAGQVAYAASTGTSIRALTADIQKATGAQIAFRDAAQAAAIGTAAGLSGDQLGRLGKAAKDVSFILGRDVTDSFNRLIRGVTKAEPELLDELGIILRLKPATEKYAQAIGKTADELTAYERSQAVVNEVLSQSESKYSIFVAGLENSENAYAKLAKAFDDLVNTIRVGVDFIAGPFAKVLTETPLLGAAGFLLLLKGPLKALGLNFDELSAKAKQSAAVYERAASIKAAAARKYALTIDETKAKVKSLTDQIRAQGNTTSEILKKVAREQKLNARDTATLNRAIDAALKKTQAGAEVTSGIFKGMTREMVVAYKTALAEMEIAEKNKATQTQANTARMRANWAALGATIRSAGAAILSFGMRLLSIVGWASLAVTALEAVGVPVTDIVKSLFGKKEPTIFDDLIEKLDIINEELPKTISNMEKFIRARVAAGDEKSVGQLYGVLGNVVGSLSADEFGVQLEALSNLAVEREQRTGTIETDMFRQILLAIGAVQGGGIEQVARTAEQAQVVVNEDYLQSTTEKDRKAAIDFANDQIEMFRQIDRYAPAEPFKKYIALLEKAVQGRAEFTAEEREAAQAARREALEYARVINELQQVMSDASRGFDSFVQNISPLTEGEKTARGLQNAIDSLETIESTSGLNDENTQALKKYKDQLEFINTLEEERNRIRLQGLKTQESNLQALNNATELERALVTIQNQQASNTQKRAEEANKIAEILATQRQRGTELTETEQRNLNEAFARLGILREQNVALEKQRALEEAILDFKKQQADNNAFQKQLDASAASLSAAEKELNTLKQINSLNNQMAQGRSQEALADIALANPFADMERLQAQENLRLAQQQYTEGMAFIEAEHNLKKLQIDQEYQLLELKKDQSILELQILKEKMKSDGASEQALASIDTAIATWQGIDYGPSRAAAEQLADKTKEAAQYGLGKAVRDAQRTVATLQPLNKILDTAADAFEKSLNDAFNSLFDSLSDKTIDLGEKLKEIARSFLKTIQQAVTEELIVKPILDALFPTRTLGASAANPMHVVLPPSQVPAGAGGSSVTSPAPGSAPTSPSYVTIVGTGGIFSPYAVAPKTILSTGAGTSASNAIWVQSVCGCPKKESSGGSGISGSQVVGLLSAGMELFELMGPAVKDGGIVSGGKKMRGYATGGVASGSDRGYPAVLHGTEAVVPLPNGRSIPVEMSGGGSQMNNVTVNVSMEGGTAKSETQSDSKMGGDLGNMIAQAVQKELQNQKRSGGILNPYGAS